MPKKKQPLTRSEIMSRVKGKDTKPELVIRRALFARGYRYRLHDRRLPGKPDIVLKKYNAVIFINGCFWHGHKMCRRSKLPSTRKEYWRTKIERNVERDQESIKSLSDSGYRILIIWGCGLEGKNRLPFNELMDEVERWLHGNSQLKEIQGLNET